MKKATLRADFLEELQKIYYEALDRYRRGLGNDVLENRNLCVKLDALLNKVRQKSYGGQADEIPGKYNEDTFGK
jgi:hypothetical protein